MSKPQVKASTWEEGRPIAIIGHFYLGSWSGALSSEIFFDDTEALLKSSSDRLSTKSGEHKPIVRDHDY